MITTLLSNAFNVMIVSAATKFLITCNDHQMHHISSNIFCTPVLEWSAWEMELSYRNNLVIKDNFVWHLNNLGNILLHGNFINLKEVYLVERYDDGMEKYRWHMRENILCCDILSKFCCLGVRNWVVDSSMIIDGKLVLKSMYSHIRVHICHFLKTVLTCCFF